MNEEYFKDSEDLCYNKLLDFNNILHLQALGRVKDKSTVDASGLTATNEEIMIELKNRNQNLVYKDNKFYASGTTYVEDSMMIETHKLTSLLLKSTMNNQIPLYINFLNDDVVVLFNIVRLKKEPTFGKKKIKSIGYGSMEVGTRMFLSLDDAYIYKKDEQGRWKRLNA